jgi:D-lactate dehydrogenase
MKLAIFDARNYDRESFTATNGRYGHDVTYFEARLGPDTAALAAGFPVVCSFVNDRLDAETLRSLAQAGVRLVALRSAGYNQVDLAAAGAIGLRVVRVPDYSPHAVAEHTVGLVLALDRRIHRAHDRVRDGNFSLDGLVGFDLHGKTVGLVGLGRIGRVAAQIFHGFGCRLLAHDLEPSPGRVPDLPIRFVGRGELYRESDVITLHVPLTPSTRHLIDASALEQMQPGVMIVNTGRGALIDTRALIEALKSGRVGAAGLDVYEEDEGIFFQDLSDRVLQDDVLARLLTFPNVLVTAHQAFLTREALADIADTTLANVAAFEAGRPLRLSPGARRGRRRGGRSAPRRARERARRWATATRRTGCSGSRRTSARSPRARS